MGPLVDSREAIGTAVVLPSNGKTLLVGGSHCYPNSFDQAQTITTAAFSAGTVTITTSATNSFDAGQTVVIAGNSAAGNNGTFTIKAITGPTKFTYTDASGAAGTGGTATQNPNAACTGTTSGFECDALNTAELYTPTSATTGTYALAGAGSGHVMTAARSGATTTLLADGTVLITGGSTGSTFLGFGPGVSSPPFGCGPTGQVSQNTAEIYNPATDTFTATAPIPGCPAGTQPPTTCTANSGDALPAICAGLPVTLSTATESGTTVTITTASVPSGMIVGGGVEVGAVSVAGYNGIFTITGPGAAGSPITGTTFTYTAATSGLGAGTGGVATAEGTSQCGVVDSVSSLLPSSALVPFGALVAGGDYITFLGQSSSQAFVYVPTYDGGPAWEPASPMNVPRELPGVSPLPSGEVLVSGGLTGAAGACVGLPAECTGAGTPNGCCTGVGVGPTCGATAVITNSSAEVFNPSTFGWTLTSGSSATPGAAGGMTTARISSDELFTSGPDAGMVITAGGINASTPSFPDCSATTAISQSTQSAVDLYDPSTTVFTGTGALNTDRGGYGFGILNGSAVFPGNLVVIGGECAEGGLASAPIGSSQATSTCGFSTYTTNYYETYDPVGAVWTVGTGSGGVGPVTGAANAPASAVMP